MGNALGGGGYGNLGAAVGDALGRLGAHLAQVSLSAIIYSCLHVTNISR